MNLLRDLFAGPGNQCWDLGRIASGWGFVLYTGTIAWQAVTEAPIDLIQLATGYAALLAGAGALIALKDRALRPPAPTSDRTAEPE